MSLWDKRRLAASVDAYWDQPNEVHFRQLVLSDLEPYLVPGGILDVGCGSGRIYAELKAHGLLALRSYLGVDSSVEMLKLARTRYPEARFEKLSIEDLQTGAPNLLCVQVLQHVPYWRSALEWLLHLDWRLLYIVTWFGDGDRHDDPRTGIANIFLPYQEVVGMCARYGVVTKTGLADGPAGALVVQRRNA